MSKRFNTTGICIPQMHYMVDITEKLNKIIEIIKRRDYFVINRPRQYGKTTTMFMVEQCLKYDYIVISISFEGIGDEVFLNEEKFSKQFIRLMSDSLEFIDKNKSSELLKKLDEVKDLADLSKVITRFIKECENEVVLFVDEVDKSSNNQLFLSFLGMLRNKYLLRQQGKDVTFSSVILAGVYDIKNLKIKIRDSEEKKYNSPWNIAVNFNIDMSFNEEEIGTMLKSFSDENNLCLDIYKLSREIYDFTSGYPFLVSRICQIVDEDIVQYRDREWSIKDIHKAIKILLAESNTLFDDLIKNLENNKELYEYMYSLLVLNIPNIFNIDNPTINLGVMFGYLSKDEDNNTIVANRIIGERIYNYLISKENCGDMIKYNFKSNFITKDNGLDMKKILLKFQQFMKENYSSKDKSFLERHGVLLFLSFIKPIINGVGFDYKEVQISEERRLDIVIQYNQFKYIIETKIWYGEVAHKKGLKQLKEYLDIENINEGYLLIFNFNKSKEYISNQYGIEGKEIFEVRV